MNKFKLKIFNKGNRYIVDLKKIDKKILEEILNNEKIVIL